MPSTPDSHQPPDPIAGIGLLTPLAGQIELRGLNRKDAPLLAAHLKRLPPHARQARFHGGMTDYGIDTYVARADWPNFYVFGTAIGPDLRAVAELVIDHGADTGEIAVSVEPDYQHLGLGRLLVLSALLAGRRMGLSRLRLTYQSDNIAMRALVSELGGEVTAGGRQITATLSVPSAGGPSHPSE